MASYNHVRIYESDAQTFVGVIADYYQMAVQIKINEPGFFYVSIDPGNPILDVIEKDYVVNIRRQNYSRGIEESGISINVFPGIFRGSIRSTDQNGVESVSLQGYGPMGLLKRAIDARYYRSRIGTVGSLLGGVFQDNVSDYSGALTNPRLRDRPVENCVTGPGQISVPSGNVYGSDVEYVGPYRNVYDVVRDLLAVDDGWLETELSDTLTPGYFRFLFHLPTFSDKTDSVFFQVERGNLVTPVLDTRRINERTAAIVGGQGERNDKIIEILTGPNYDVDDNNNELFLDLSHIADTTELQNQGDIVLQQEFAKDELSGEVIQLPGSNWPEHYDLGDLVSVIYGGQVITKQISGITLVDTPEDGESIGIEFRDVATA